MAARLPTIAFIALLLTIVGAEAAVRVKDLMRGWKADMQSAEQIVAAPGPINQAELARILSGFASDATDMSARITKASAADLRARFDKFAADSRAAAAVQAKGKLSAAIGDLRQECRSCHDAYAN